jgi:hypothetical protein
MRNRLFIISSLAIASVVGLAGAAQAAPPQCCGDKIAPKPPQGDDFDKGPGDIAQPQPDRVVDAKPNDNKPNGPGDLAQPQGDPVVDPAPNGGNTDNGNNNDGSDNGDTSDTDSVVGGVNVDDTGATGDAAADTASDNDSAGMSPFVLIIAAAIVGGLLAVLATRRRRDDEDVEQI